MKHAEVELFLCREMPHTGHKRLPQRPIIGPLRKDFIDGRIVNGRFAIGLCRDRQALPLHAGVEHPQNQVKNESLASLPGTSHDFFGHLQ